MNRRDFLKTTSVGIGLSTFLPSWLYGAKRKKPNFVLIMVDDMGYSDPGRFRGEVQTPNINSLAMVWSDDLVHWNWPGKYEY